jgi:hypothetical protein
MKKSRVFFILGWIAEILWVGPVFFLLFLKGYIEKDPIPEFVINTFSFILNNPWVFSVWGSMIILRILFFVASDACEY